LILAPTWVSQPKLSGCSNVIAADIKETLLITDSSFTKNIKESLTITPLQIQQSKEDRMPHQWQYSTADLPNGNP
jgi:hypothetical protein